MKWDTLEGKSEIWRIALVSGMSMVVLRISFAKLYQGHNEFAQGPSAILEFFLNATRRKIS